MLLMTTFLCALTDQGLERQLSGAHAHGNQGSCVAAALYRFTAEGSLANHASPFHAAESEANHHSTKREVRLGLINAHAVWLAPLRAGVPVYGFGCRRHQSDGRFEPCALLCFPACISTASKCCPVVQIQRAELLLRPVAVWDLTYLLCHRKSPVIGLSLSCFPVSRPTPLQISVVTRGLL